MLRIDPTLVAVIVAVVLCIFVIRFLFRPKGPPTVSFKCARCGTVARHTKRTVEAWRRKANRLYCDACHRRWLETQPHQTVPTNFSAVTGGSRRGCLGALLVLLCIPIALVAFALYA